jgi:hypothetical protein
MLSFVLVVTNASPSVTEKLSGLTVYYSNINLGEALFDDGVSKNAYLTSGSGRLHIENQTINEIYLKIFGSLLEAFVYIYIVYLLMGIIENLKRDDFFVRENGVFIRKIGFSIIAITIFTDLFNFIISKIVSNELIIANIEFKPYVNFHLNTVFLGVLILAIAQIFIKGAEMKTEQDLTI